MRLKKRETDFRAISRDSMRRDFNSRIVVVGVIPDLDVRGRHHIFDIAGCAVFVWKNRVGTACRRFL